MDNILLIIFGAVSAWIAWIFIQRKTSNFPPGPLLRFPFLGHLPLLGMYPYKTLLQWREKHGPIVGLWFGSFPAIALNEESVIREAANMNSFTGRPITEFIREWGGGGEHPKGLVLSQGAHWNEQRKFAIKNLRSVGAESSSMEAVIQDEALELIEELKSKTGKPLRMQNVFELQVARTVYNATLSAPPEKGNDEELKSVLLSISRIATEFKAVIGIASFVPWLSKWFPRLSGMAEVKERIREIQNFMQRRAKEHDETRPNIPRDFTDTYLEKVERTKDSESSFHPRHKTIENVLQDVVSAGSESTNSVLTWMFLYLVKWPEIQKKLCKEIDSVVGHERYPSLSDRPQMPYTVAVICETLRHSNVFPLSISHLATEDTNFHGYHVPKGTFVILNLYAAHFDPKVWGDPEEFRPERFLDESGSNIVNKEHLLTFSPGKRACIGESLAWDELFMFTTQIFQVFQVEAAGKLPSLDGVLALTLSAHPFDVVFEKRQAE